MRVCSLCQRCYSDLTDHCTEESHPPLAEARAGSCDLVPGYQLELLLEATTNSEIYRGRHTRSGQSCLIKIVEASDEYLDAVDIASSFFHPGVAAVYETGALDTGEQYLITEDAGGPTLRDVFSNDRAPSLVTAIRIARQAAEALDVLHTSGLTHGAINPANLALETDYSIKLQNLDLGGVSSRSIASEKVLDGSGLYSLRYFSPEQCAGEMPGPQTDIYSLGVVLYEMLAGRPPFDGHTPAALIHGHRNQPPPDLRISNFDLRMLLTHTVMESLQKQPAKRQASASAFARQLRQIEQLATHASTPPPAGEVQVPVAAVPVQPVPAVQPIKKVELLIDREIPEPIPFRPEAGSIASSLGYDPVPLHKIYNKHTEPKAEVVAEAERAVQLDDLDGLNDFADAIPTTAELPQAVSYPPSRPSPFSLIKQRFAETLAQLGSVLTKNAADPASQIKPIQFKAVAAQIPALLAERERLASAGILKKEPTKVAWEPPEDDIPAETEAVGALVQPEIITPIEEYPIPQPVSLFAISPAEIPAEEPAASPIEIEAVESVQPEVEIHSPEHRSRLKRCRKRSHKRIASWPTFIEDAQDTSVVQVKNTAWIEPEGDIPSVPAELPTRAEEVPIPEPVVAFEPEEITLVRPPSRRLEISWEHPSTAQVPLAPEITFVPTLLGERKQGRSDLVTHPGRRRRIYRPAAMAGGIAAVIALYVFAGDLISKYIPTWSAGEPPVARAVPQVKTPKRTAPVDLRELPGKSPAKTVEKPFVEEEEVVEMKPTPTRIQEKVPATKQVSRTIAVKANVPKQTISKLIPSTLVIYSDNGTIRTRTEPAKTERNITDGRPRKVKDPFR